MSIFEQMADDRDALTPESGFNVVLIDDFNFPPETIVKAHCETLEEAKSAMAEIDGSAVVYDAEGKAVASK